MHLGFLYLLNISYSYIFLIFYILYLLDLLTLSHNENFLFVSSFIHCFQVHFDINILILAFFWLCYSTSFFHPFTVKWLMLLLLSCFSRVRLRDPIDGSPPGSPVPGILQARTLEWVAISFSSAWKWKVKVKSLSRVRLLATPWTAAYQAPPSMGFSRQEYWNGVPLPSPTWLIRLYI